VCRNSICPLLVPSVEPKFDPRTKII
jgi:hypothetical protein